MAENESQSQTNGAAGVSGVSNDALRKYLLTLLVEKERLGLDQQLLVDDHLAERMRLAESQLIEDYADGKLGPSERDLFLKKFLITDSRRQQLNLTNTLQSYAATRSTTRLAPATDQRKTSWREALAALFGQPSRGWAIAGSLAALVLVVGLIWFAAKRGNETQPLIATSEPVPKASPQTPTQTDLHSALPSPSTSPAVKKPAVTGTPESGPPPRVASYALVAGALRSGGDMSRIAVPRGDRDLVRFSLVLDGLVEGPYRAELNTAEGQKVLVRNQLRATVIKDEVTVVLEVPARLLPAGDYQLKLTSQKPSSRNQPAGSFYFRALNE